MIGRVACVVMVLATTYFCPRFLLFRRNAKTAASEKLKEDDREQLAILAGTTDDDAKNDPMSQARTRICFSCIAICGIDINFMVFFPPLNMTVAVT